LILGAVAGFTIYLGLPLAMTNASGRLKGILNALAIGILLFLLVDIMQDAMEVSQEKILGSLSGEIPYATGLLFPLVFLGGIGGGLLGLVWFESRFIRGGKPAHDEGKARRLAMMIAIGIGLHNFSEGLAIGQSYASGVIPLAITLVVGFGLHNMTEGFGIAAPLSGYKPGWKYLALLGFIGGGPTFIGALVGSVWVSELVSVLFLSMAGGAVIYVVKELLYHGKTSGEGFDTMAALVGGFMLGFATLVLVHHWAG
jgi:ZIP family zinc transporter